MWSKRLESKIAKHRAFGKEILDYANSVLGVGLRYTSVNKLAIELEMQRQKQNVDNNDIPPFVQELEKKIEQYRKEAREVQKLKIQEKTEGASQGSSKLPENPVLVKLAKANDAVIKIWKKGKYKCGSLPEFVKEYSKLADNISPDLIRTYLISERTGKAFAPRTISNAIFREGPGRKVKS